MASVNLVMLLGHLCGDVVTRMTRSGQKLATFTIATNNAFIDKEGRKQDIATFHNVIATGELETYALAHLKKGTRAYVEGRIHTRVWRDKRTNEDRRAIHVIADKLQEMPKPSASSYYWEDDNESRNFQPPAPPADQSTAEAPQSAEAPPSTQAPTTENRTTQNAYARAKG